MRDPGGKRRIYCLPVAALLALILCSPAVSALPCQTSSSEEIVPELERKLFELVNRERADRGLRPVELSLELRELARSHSRDMADMRRLSHDSSSGKPYSRRLVDRGIFFLEVGENVAFSDTYVPEVIHNALMESPRHREVILTAAYDRVGIGVVTADGKGFYVTQDFILSLVPLTAAEAEDILKKMVNEARRHNASPPLLFSPVADSLARRYSEKRALGETPPRVAGVLGETLIAFTTTGTLSPDNVITKSTRSPDYEEGGLGIWFGRNELNPGGAYFITTLLLKRNAYAEQKPEALRDAILQTINRMRQKTNLEPLTADKMLCEEAEKCSRALARGKGTPLTVAPTLGGTAMLIFYVTPNPANLPESVPPQVCRPELLRIGIGLEFKKTSEFPGGAFAVTLLLREGRPANGG
jgi:uncharacterized protein YkwD